MYAASPLLLPASVAENPAPMRRKTLALPCWPPWDFLVVDTAFAAKSANAPLVKLFEPPGRRTWPMTRCRPPSSVTRATTTAGPTCRSKPSTAAKRRTTRACRRCARSTAKNSIKADQLNYDLFERDIRTPHRGLPVQAVAVRHAHLRRPAAAGASSPSSPVQDGQGLRQLDRAHQLPAACTSTSGSCC